MSTLNQHILLRDLPRRVESPPGLAVSTVYRWALKGVGRPPVRLATCKIGGRRYTTMLSWQAFVTAMSDRAGSSPAHAHDTSVDRAEHELDADGIS